jgi:hypothetical protein
MGLLFQLAWNPRYISSERIQQKTLFLSLSLYIASIIACLFVAAGTCLQSRCLGMIVYSGSAIPPFTRYFTIIINIFSRQ